MPDILDSIDWGSAVASTSVTVYFAAAGESFGGFTSQGWTAYEMGRAMAALNEYAAVSNLTFSITAVSATATFKLVTTTSAALGGALGQMSPPGEPNAGVGVFARDVVTWDQNGTTGALFEGGFGYITLLHEFGHGLGMAHPHDDGGSSVIMEGVTGPDSHGSFSLNQGVYTVMSYNFGWELHPQGTSSAVFYGWSGGLGALDIALIQEKYGAKASNAGVNTYTLSTTNSTGTFYQTIYDTGGTDTIVNPGSADSVISLIAATIDYSATGGGGISYVNGIYGGFTIAQGVVIENATGGGGNDVITGNSAANILIGGNGNDSLTGGLGADQMDGGAGNDTFSVDNALDQVTEASAAGTDRIYTSLAAYQLGANVEELFFAGVPTANFAGTGNGLDNVIWGWDGNDTLDGGVGADDLYGFAGNDIFKVDNSLDEVVEAASAGTDSVYTTLASYTLGANLENLIYEGTQTADFTGTGNELANYLEGWDGDDTLDGGGGADEMQGLAGDDLYAVDNSLDLVVEAESAGYDGVTTTLAAYTLPAHVEALQYSGVSTADFTGTGNALDNLIEAWNGNDQLDGGAGADEMYGLGGNDAYKVDNSLDEVVEEADAGTDAVETTLAAYALTANVEGLIYAGPQAGDFIGTGNDLANVIWGWDGDDTLDGGGGADQLTGFLGDDAYYLDQSGEQVVEETNEGTDTVFVALTVYSLGPNLENLIFNGGQFDAFTGSGNELDNLLQGRDGNDTLDGFIGADELRGLGGNDTYKVDNSLDSVIEAASAGTDTVEATLASHTLAANVEHLLYTGPQTADFAGIGNGLANSITGGNGDDALDGAGGPDILTGKLGDDSYYVDNIGETVIEQADAGTDIVYVALGVYTLGANLENLAYNSIGGDFAGTGNGLVNVITSLSGDDTLDGAGGADDLRGGAGNDTYKVDNGLDLVTEAADSGTDTVETTLAAYTLGSNVERLEYSGTPTADFAGTGNALANFLQGGQGDDSLDGAAGADQMQGLAGDDTYQVDHEDDDVVEAADQGTDAVETTLQTYALTANVENLAFTGLSGSFTGTGNALANAITGGASSDLLDGGAGADTLTGGAGTDTYVVDSLSDNVVELAGGGADDRLWTALAAFTLPAEVEILVGQSQAGQALTGNGLANEIVGQSGHDALDGAAGNDILKGGAGNDELDGGLGDDAMQGEGGNDIYLIDSAADTIVETATTGSTADVARSSVSYTLGAAVRVETLMTTSAAGTDSINLIGNEFANTVTGNAGANLLKGMAANDSLAGDAGNDELDGGSGDDALNGGAGNDTYLVDSAADAIVETLTTGSTADVAKSSVSYTLGAGVRVESLMTTAPAGIALINLTGNEFANAITGNAGANILKGMAANDSLIGDAGNDSLDGGTGDDALNGGAGNDSYVLDSAADTIVETLTTGSTADVAKSSVSYTLGAGVRVESLMTTSLAGTGLINLTGNEFANAITGNAGANILKGMAGNDSLVGDAGNDNLDGGVGNDTLNGGAGNDSYTLDSASDVIVETLTTGSTADVAKATVSYVLGAGVRVEQLMTTSLAGTFSIHLTGNEFANTITGNAAANTLKGMGGNDTLKGDAGSDSLDGGTGNDVMDGGAGNDSYRIDSAADAIVETLTTGSTADIARSAVSYALAAGVRVEQLMTTSVTGTTLIDLTGNEFANAITGNAGANLLKGMGGNDSLKGDAGPDTLDGGTGADTLDGGVGDDGYVLDSASDIIVETATTGSAADVAKSSVTYVLGAGVRVETLMTTSTTGAALIDLTGNEFGNAVTGNAAANILKGMGGSDTLKGAAGNDNLQGGTGSDKIYGGLGNDVLRGDASAADHGIDRFYFDSAPNAASNRDQIIDFNPADDFIHLARSIFTQAGAAGTLAVDAFHVIGVGAADAQDRILYNSATGALFYDPDGTGAAAAVQFATLTAGLALANTDFILF